MGTYSQWAKSRKLPRVAWVCGPEGVLRLDVIECYRAAYGRGNEMFVDVAQGAGAWDQLLSVPSAPRLAVVLYAEKLTRLELLPLLLADELDTAFTVFVSGEGDFARVTADGRDSQKRLQALHPSLAALRDSRHGLLVRCCAPVDAEAKAGLVAAWWPGAGRNLGASLLERCGGDLWEAYQAARKACLAGYLPSPQAVELVCPASAVDDYAEQLVAGNVKKALAAAAVADPDQSASVLALLSSRLGTLALLGDAARKGEDVGEVSRRMKIDPYVVRQLRPHASSYTRERAAQCRQLLAMAESAWHSGARTGILEAVAVLW